MHINWSNPNVSAREQSQLIATALTRWKAVAPSSVSLEKWVCGTQACFGGHLAQWPEFQTLGIRPVTDVSDLNGEPHVPGHNWCSYDIGHILFGDNTIFLRRGNHIVDDDANVSDHELIVKRLQWALQKSKLQDVELSVVSAY